MDGHQRNLYLYERLNARVLGVSMDDVVTNKYFAKEFWLEFPLLSNPLAWIGKAYGAYSDKPPFLPDGTPNWFGRRTVVIDKKGIVRYIKNGSPDNKEILHFLVNLEKEAMKK
ncbi:MAG: redoxin domain-containing protein [Thermodesulfobacteriota bacterium]|nr:redoxin domain-containing protein [Thermodesulfobacteriota bacterium]